jgi:hypothetical protein
MVGQLPSSIDPQTQYVNMNSEFFYPNNYVWLWTAPANDVTGSGTDAAGYTTPCMGCSVSKVTALAQNGGFTQDGSYFGAGGNGNEINWLEVIFGEYSSSCTGETGGTCQIESSSDPTTYYAGTQAYPDDVTAQTNQGPTSWGPYESWDGIAVGGGGSVAGEPRSAAGSFTEPLPPPPCTADSDGLCSLNTANTNSNSYWCYAPSLPHGGYNVFGKSVNTYAIYRQSSFVEKAAKTTTRTGCPGSTAYAWSPNNPATQYNDPNLP